MAGYGGYFMQGLAGGLQSGLQIGQQLQEMKWQKKQKEELKKKTEELQSASLSIQNKIKEYGLDGTYSDNEITDLSTMMWAGGSELQEIYKQTLADIKAGNKQKVDQDFELIDMWVNEITGLSVDDISASYKELSKFITTDRGKNYLNANASIKKKKAEGIANQPAQGYDPLDVYKATPSANMPYGMTEQMGSMVGFNMPGEMPTTPTAPEQPPTELDKMAEDKKFLDSAYATGNANYFNNVAKGRGIPTTFDTYKQGYEKPEPVSTGGAGEAPKPSAMTTPGAIEGIREDIVNADNWKDGERIFNNHNKKYGSTAELGFENIEQAKEAWAGKNKEYLSNILNVIKGMVNEKGWLKKEETATYEEYRDEYMKYRDILEKEGIDISQFPKIKPLSEIEKVGFLEGVKTFGGVGKGQYKSIYY